MNETSLYFTFLGIAGILCSLILFMVLLVKQTSYLLKKKGKPVRPLRSVIYSLLLLVLLTTSGMNVFIGFFLRSWASFNQEQKIAEIRVIQLPQSQKFSIELKQFADGTLKNENRFEVYGDQWLLEGDILKWDPWLSFTGLQTRYRLTRISGRYLYTADEIQKPRSVYSLVRDENHPFWRIMYKLGQDFPFVDTVYGSAVFQTGQQQQNFDIYVNSAGFITRRRVAADK